MNSSSRLANRVKCVSPCCCLFKRILCILIVNRTDMECKAKLVIQAEQTTKKKSNPKCFGLSCASNILCWLWSRGKCDVFQYEANDINMRPICDMNNENQTLLDETPWKTGPTKTTTEITLLAFYNVSNLATTSLKRANSHASITNHLWFIEADCQIYYRNAADIGLSLYFAWLNAMGFLFFGLPSNGQSTGDQAG